jgi:hypothetical protein
MLFDGYQFPSSVFYTNEEEKQLLASLLELQRGAKFGRMNIKIKNPSVCPML